MSFFSKPPARSPATRSSRASPVPPRQVDRKSAIPAIMGQAMMAETLHKRGRALEPVPLRGLRPQAKFRISNPRRGVAKISARENLCAPKRSSLLLVQTLRSGSSTGKTYLVSRLGLEPRTPALKGQCSTVELPAHHTSILLMFQTLGNRTVKGLNLRQ